jgi:uncharacterized protein YpmS
MKARYFVLGALTGIAATAAALVVIAAVLITRPVPDVATPPSPASGDLILTVGEDYLSTLATNLARSEERRIQRVVVDVHPEARVDMTVAARLTVLGRQTDVEVKLATLMQVDGERLALSVPKVSLAGIEIPLDRLPESVRSVVRSVEATVNQELSSTLGKNGFVPASVTTDDSSISIILQTR